MHSESVHQPVLLDESLSLLSLEKGNAVLDVTLGLGGHASHFAERIGSEGKLFGIDADSENLLDAKNRLASQPCSQTYIHANFMEIPQIDIPPCNAIFADLGVSSPHLDDPEKGFTFQQDAPLDMRYNRANGKSVAHWISNASEIQIVDVLKKFAEVPPYKLASYICEQKPKTTGDLKHCVQKIFGNRAEKMLPQVFQAFRIVVNDELAALEVLLTYGISLLKPGGRMAIISYHSLEDRLVKHAFRSLVEPEIDDHTGAITEQAPYLLLTKKPITPSEKEIEHNPRSRSAKLRAIQKR